MSWEVMKSETTKCQCGKGTMTYIIEMDHSNRVRSATEIHCPECRQRAELETEKRRQEALRNKALYHEAKQLAMDRYLAKWLDLYSGLSKRDAWQRYTGASGHPVGPKYSTDLREASVNGRLNALRRQVFYDGASTCAIPSIAPAF